MALLAALTEPATSGHPGGSPGGPGGPVRVLYVVHYPVFGGPHNYAICLNEELARHGLDLAVLLPDEAGNARERLEAAGVETCVTKLHRFRATRDPRPLVALAATLPAEVRRIRDLIRERSIDVVVIGGLVNPHAALAARREGVPVVWEIVDSRTPPALRRPLAMLASRLAAALRFNGEAIRRLHLGERPPDLPAWTFWSPVDTTRRFAPDPSAGASVRRELGIAADSQLVGCVANLNPQKGIEYFVRACALIHRQRPDSEFLLVGEEYESQRPYTELIDREIAASGIPPAQFHRASGPSDRFYQAMDVKMITSVPRSEGTTSTAMEAMAVEVPVVATDVGAVREVVRDGIDGSVVPPLDPGALARAVVILLDDVEARRRLGTEGRRSAVARFGAVEYARDYARQIATLPGPRGRLPDLALGAAGGFELPLACPACRTELVDGPDQLECRLCGLSYPRLDGIPVLFRADGSEAAAYKLGQASFFDAEDPEFEMTRPHGQPALYRWLMAEKLGRSLRTVHGLPGRSLALTVCGGSGMDAEHLARCGFRVIASDISLEAARRTRERAARLGLSIVPIVADAERLPFAAGAVSVAYVHDGLHHLQDPDRALREMARVAADAVSVNEPARAALTRLAARVGLADTEEEAGNLIERLRPQDVCSVLAESGFTITAASRYGMLYRHRPGRLMKLLSEPGLLTLTTVGIRTFNALGGRIGNKLTIQAARTRPLDESRPLAHPAAAERTDSI